MNKELTYGLKSIFVLMVFFQHFIFAANQGLYSDVIPEFTLIFRGDVAVGCLFIISGYVLMKSWGNKEPEFFRELVRRAGRLIIPMIGAYVVLYMVSSIGAGTWGQMLPRMGYDWGYILSFGTSSDITANDLVASFLNQLIGYNDQQILFAWVLRHELIMSVFLLIAITLFGKPSQRKILSALVIGLISWTLYKGVAYGLYAAFGTGVLLAQYESKIKELDPKKVLIFIVVVTIAAYAVIEMDLLWDDHWKAEQINKGRAWLIMLMTDDRYFCFSLMIPYFVLIVKYLARYTYIQRAMAWAGKRSYSLYLMSQFAMQICVWCVYKTETYLPPIILFFACFGLAILMGDLFFRIVEKPAMRIWQRSASSTQESEALMRGV